MNADLQRLLCFLSAPLMKETLTKKSDVTISLVLSHSQNNERRGNLNEGLLRCGKFQEALQSLLSWIADTEGMVKNQSGPSSDYNVLQAQMSEQQVSRFYGDQRVKNKIQERTF